MKRLLAATLMLSLFFGATAPGQNLGGGINNVGNISGNITPTSTPPGSPAFGATWLSSNLAYMRTDPRPLAHVAVVRPSVNAQEPVVWLANNLYNMMFTSSGLEYTSCPVTSDPLASFNAVASINSATFTVTAVNSGTIQPGMIIDAGNNGTSILPYGTNGTTGTGGIGTYQLSVGIGTSSSQNRSGSFWSQPVTVIGNGQGGVNDAAAHSNIYIEGSTLYSYFVDTNTNAVDVATASITTPTVWTYQNQIVSGSGIGSGTTNGNPRVVKNGSIYYLFQEGLNFDTFPGEGLTDSWQEFECTSSSPLGPFTGCTELTSLRPGPNASESDMSIVQQNGIWMAYYHSQIWGRVLPSDIYVAANANIAADTWVPGNHRTALLKRTNNYEVDQTADPKLVQSPGGAWYMFYTAGDNTSGGQGFHIMAVPLLPTLMQWDGNEWVPADLGDNNAPPARNAQNIYFQENVPWLSPSGSSSAGTWNLETATVPGGYLRYNSSNAQNDSIQWDTFLPPGTYALTLNYQTGSTNAVFTIALSDGTNQNFPVAIGTLDAYSASPSTASNTLSFTIYGTETMRRRIRFLAATRNASSTGWTLADYGWTITKTDF